MRHATWKALTAGVAIGATIERARARARQAALEDREDALMAAWAEAQEQMDPDTLERARPYRCGRCGRVLYIDIATMLTPVCRGDLSYEHARRTMREIPDDV